MCHYRLRLIIVLSYQIEDSLKTSERSGTDKDKTDASAEFHSGGCENLSIDATHISDDGLSHALDSHQGADQIEIGKDAISTDKEPDGSIKNKDIAVANDLTSQPLKSEKEIPTENRDSLSKNNNRAHFRSSVKNCSSSEKSLAEETAEVPGDPTDWASKTPSKASLEEAETVPSNDGSDWETRTPSKTSLKEAETIPSNDGSDWEIGTPSKTSLKGAETVPSNDGSDWETRTPSKTSLEEVKTVPSNDGSDWETRTPSKTSLIEGKTVLSNDGSDWEVRKPSETSLERSVGGPNSTSSSLSKTCVETETAVKSSAIRSLETSPMTGERVNTLAPPSATSDLETGILDKTLPQEQTGVVPSMSRTSLDEESASQFAGGSDWETCTPSKTSLVEGTAVGPSGGSDWETGTPSKTSLDIDSLAQPPPFSEGNEETHFKNSLKDEMAEYPGGSSDLEPGGPTNSMLIQTTSAANGEKSFLMISISFVSRMKLILGNAVRSVRYVPLGSCGEGLSIASRTVCGVYHRVLMLTMMS